MDKNLVFHRICKLLGIHYYYENRYGIKVFNKESMEFHFEMVPVELNPQKVCLGFDGLRNPYSLCGTYIPNSPHFDMMKKISLCEDIHDCEYVKREKIGTLDGRYGIIPSDHYSIFQKAKQRIEDGVYTPAIVYQVKNQFYAFDGKHRLALCCLLDRNCKCFCISLDEFQNDSYTLQLYKKMRGKKDYSKNLALLENILL